MSKPAPTPAPTASPKETLDPLLQEFYNLRSYGEAVRQQIDVVQGIITEFMLSKASLEEIKKREGKGETLIHIGAGNYVRAQLQDVKTVVVGIGAGVSIEKGLDDAISEVDQRVKQAQTQMTDLQNQYAQIAAKLDQLQGRIDQLYSQIEPAGQA